MIVVIEHFFERAAINHCLISFETFALFSFERFDRNRAELDSLNRAPRSHIALQDLDSVKACVLKCGEKILFHERAGNATCPKLRIILHFLRDFLITDDIADNGTTAFLEHTENFFEQLPFRFRFYEIENTIGDDHVDGVAGDERMFDAQFFGQLIGSNKILIQVVELPPPLMANHSNL